MGLMNQVRDFADTAKNLCPLKTLEITLTSNLSLALHRGRFPKIAVVGQFRVIRHFARRTMMSTHYAMNIAWYSGIGATAVRSTLLPRQSIAAASGVPSPLRM
ncbi:hypothetical protein X777_07261 [Ooceraea biroi]|uniref:Uncharacterized protein n=1 Tax=Ooceraea biroi TaxID=2015173 RepID=A0A026WAS8_OOCBI|nr:hypothetical protein X777_07261 [Ooceraea biroi]